MHLENLCLLTFNCKLQVARPGLVANQDDRQEKLSFDGQLRKNVDLGHRYCKTATTGELDTEDGGNWFGKCNESSFLL